MEEKNIGTKELVKTEAKPITAQESGILIPDTLEAQYRLAKYYVASKLMPSSFDTPEKLLVALQYCFELGIKPMTGIRQMAVIRQTPSLWGDLPLALVRSSGLLKMLEEKIFDKDMKEISFENKNLNAEVYGGYCKAERTNGETKDAFYTMDDAKKAGLDKKDCYVKHPKDMLIYRARSRVLKSLFPEILNGVAIAEYDFSVHGEEIVNQKVIADCDHTSVREDVMNTKTENIISTDVPLTDAEKEAIKKEEATLL